MEVDGDEEGAREAFVQVSRDHAQSDAAPGAYHYLGLLTLEGATTPTELDDALAQFSRVVTLYPQSDRGCPARSRPRRWSTVGPGASRMRWRSTAASRSSTRPATPLPKRSSRPVTPWPCSGSPGSPWRSSSRSGTASRRAPGPRGRPRPDHRPLPAVWGGAAGLCPGFQLLARRRQRAQGRAGAPRGAEWTAVGRIEEDQERGGVRCVGKDGDEPRRPGPAHAVPRPERRGGVRGQDRGAHRAPGRPDLLPSSGEAGRRARSRSSGSSRRR